MKRIFRLPFFLAALMASTLPLAAAPTPDKSVAQEAGQAARTIAELRSLLAVSTTDRVLEQGKRLSIMLAALIAGTMSTQYAAAKTNAFFHQFNYFDQADQNKTLFYSLALATSYTLAYFLTSYLVAAPEEQALYRTLVTWPTLRKTAPTSIAEKIEPLFAAFKGNGYQLSLDGTSAKRVQQHVLEIVVQAQGAHS